MQEAHQLVEGVVGPQHVRQVVGAFAPHGALCQVEHAHLAVAQERLAYCLHAGHAGSAIAGQNCGCQQPPLLRHAAASKAAADLSVFPHLYTTPLQLL